MGGQNWPGNAGGGGMRGNRGGPNGGAPADSGGGNRGGRGGNRGNRGGNTNDGATPYAGNPNEPGQD
jgi:hypothetical protein